jgi:hypothetical protein
MNASHDHSHLPASAAHRRQSLDEWQQLLARYPLTSPIALGFQIGSTLLSNGIVAWLVISARMTPFELVLLVAIEAVFLIGIAWLQSRTVPPAARETKTGTLRARLGTFAFLLVWLGGVYGIVLFAMVPSGAEFLRLWRDPLAFLAQSSLKWPLLITLAGAGIDAVQDGAHFRRQGGKFLSTPGFHGGARLLTLILGGIPFVVPFFGAVIGLKLAADRIVARYRRLNKNPRRDRILGVIAAIVVVSAFMFADNLINPIVKAMAAGVAGWALCYAAAKFVSELFIVCLPLIATKAHAEESAAPLLGAARPARRSRLP